MEEDPGRSIAKIIKTRGMDEAAQAKLVE